MKKSNVIGLVLLGSALIGISSCQQKKPHNDQNLYIRGNDQDDYSRSHGGFHSFYPFIYYSGSGYHSGGYDSRSFRSSAIHYNSNNRGVGHSSSFGQSSRSRSSFGSSTSRGGFGHSSHSVSS